MKTLSQYLNENTGFAAKDSFDEAAGGATVKAAKQEIHSIVKICNAKNEKMGKAYAKEVQQRIKAGSPKNVDAAIEKWMKLNSKSDDDILTKEDWKKLYHTVTAELWKYNGELATSCDEFDFYEDSSDKAYKAVTDAKRKAFKALGF